MVRTLITGMSAAGKSSTIHQLVSLGHHAVDLDTEEWSEFVPDDSEHADPGMDSPLDWRWRENRVRALLTTAGDSLYVAGTSTNQASLYLLLHHVVLLTVPTHIAMARLATRTTNDYGKAPGELHRESHLRTIVEPKLRVGACLVIDTSAASVADVATLITEHASGMCGA